MDFDNDIGNFGLPPLNNTNTDNQNNKSSRSSSRLKKKARGAKPSKPKKCARKNDMNQPPHRRYNTKKSCIGRTMDNNFNDKNESDNDSSDDDEIALSDLAKMAPPPRKLPDPSSNRRAVVTPASFFTNTQTQQSCRSKSSKREGHNDSPNESVNGEGQHCKKLKRQIGLD